MSMAQPLVSIGIPTYNRPVGILRVLQEITNQTYSNIEIIVSDNYSLGSETEKIVGDLMQKDRRITYFKQAENIGSFNNYKFLLEQSKGKYFMWVCDDDFRHPEYIEACMQEFESSNSLILVNGHSARLNSQGKVILTDKGCTTIGVPVHDRYIKYISTIFTKQAAVGDVLYGVMKREVLANVMSNQINIIAWDHVLLAHLALKGEFYTIPRQLMSASEGGISSTDAKTAKAQLIEGSRSEKMPFWVREICLQQIIWDSLNLNRVEKLYLSIWSYSFYFLTHGLKMWVKGVSPALFMFLKNKFSPEKSLLSIDQ
jgi:glycosyltransferase involved in cell wall biosynthesis